MVKRSYTFLKKEGAMSTNSTTNQIPHRKDCGQQSNTQLKNWLSDCAFAELKAANNGIRILTVQQRQRLAEQCVHEMPADGTIGYSMRRQEAINRMEAMRRIYLRDTIRHLKHSHKLIQMTLNLMSDEQKTAWAVANERSGIVGPRHTRSHERLTVLAKFEELKPTLYPEKVAA
jgi:hypothetical protein